MIDDRFLSKYAISASPRIFLWSTKTRQTYLRYFCSNNQLSWRLKLCLPPSLSLHTPSHTFPHIPSYSICCYGWCVETRCQPGVALSMLEWQPFRVFWRLYKLNQALLSASLYLPTSTAGWLSLLLSIYACSLLNLPNISCNRGHSTNSSVLIGSFIGRSVQITVVVMSIIDIKRIQYHTVRR